MGNHIYNLQKDKKDSRDYLMSQYKELGEIPSSSSLRDKFKFIYNQGSLGSCSSNAAVMFMMYLHGFKVPKLSRLFHYWQERSLSGTVGEDSGATLRDACKVSQSTGVCEEVKFPYKISTFTDEPSVEMVLDAQNYRISSYHRALSIDDVEQAIAMNYPVMIGMDVYESMESQEVASTGILPMPKLGENYLGGHAILIVGYSRNTKKLGFFQRFFRKLLKLSTSAGNFEVLNSWGEQWGDAGFFHMPYAYFDKHVQDAWVLVLEEGA